MKKEKRYWLVKTEPTSYSIDDFKRDKVTSWTGVRNYQARNFIRSMNKGDKILFYHSGSSLPAVTGIGTVVTQAYPDPTQFDAKDSHFDAKSKLENPLWSTIDLKFTKKFKKPVTLLQIKANSTLKNMPVTAVGSRLSVQPVLEKHFHFFERS